MITKLKDNQIKQIPYYEGLYGVTPDGDAVICRIIKGKGWRHVS